MIVGQTKSGFKYEFAKERLENYELLELLGELEEKPVILPKVINLLLGKKQSTKLKDHVRDDEGLVPSEKISKEIEEIFKNQKVKN